MPDHVFLFAPGAGAPSTHPWMRRWAHLLGGIGAVETLDYPYMLAASRRPDPLPILIDSHRAALARVREKYRAPVVLIGKSMGSRVGCHVSLQDEVPAVVCLGYPLCGAGDRAKLRDKVLREMTAPILFVQGTRDSLCPLDLLENVRAEMRTSNELETIADGDHSLAITKRQAKASGETQDDVDRRIIATIQAFIFRIQGTRGAV